MLDILQGALRDAVLVSGLVVVMMMLIESFNVESGGRTFRWLGRSRVAQVIVSASLGAVPGCIGGFAAASLYTHRMLSFGALLAMMIATAGDEAFFMLAMFPGKAAGLFLLLFVLAIAAGLLADAFSARGRRLPTRLEDTFDLHADDGAADGRGKERHFGWKRIVMSAGVVLFLGALALGVLEEEDPQPEELDLFSEKWMYAVFAVMGLFLLAALLFASDHFVEEHLWEHIVCKHLPALFAWTFGTLLVIGILFSRIDLNAWVGGNPVLMILLAVAVGLIPESGPHMVFVTLFAGGVIPFPVLLANSIVQDGHASLPLLADSKAAWLKAKAIKTALALLTLIPYICINN